MANRILFVIILFGFLAAKFVSAQEVLPKNWNTEKIRGTRLIPYASFSGTPYLNDKFVKGEIEFLDGTKVSGIGLRYSSYRDELIYYNTVISAQIIIDKISLKGFSFTDGDRVRRIFRQQYYDGFLNGNRFFEVLSDGDVSVLAYRKVVLLNCALYTDESGKQKNMSYEPAYNYYLYNAKNGYESIRIGKNSLLTKFDKPVQKMVKKILRKNKVTITDEKSFVRAWNLIKENGIKITIGNKSSN